MNPADSRLLCSLAVAAAAALAGPPASAQFASGCVRRASLSSASVEANADVFDPRLSPDGSVVAFWSFSNTLVTQDLNGSSDVFARSLLTGETVQVSVDANGTPQGGDSGAVGGLAVSPGGGFIAFPSVAQLAGLPTGGVRSIFVRGNLTTLLASADSFGTPGNAESRAPSISADGRFLVFQSLASNLAGADSNGTWDIYIHDVLLGRTNRVTLSPIGLGTNGASIAPAISQDSRFVAFESAASNLIAGDTNSLSDIFIWQRSNKLITRVSVDGGGNQANGASSNPAISGDGRYVAFESVATNLAAGDTNNAMDIFLRDQTTGAIDIVSRGAGGVLGNGPSSSPWLDGPGTVLAFESAATNLVANDVNGFLDVFTRDLAAGTNILWSTDFSGNQGNGDSRQPSVSDDGCRLAYASRASNLVPSDLNGTQDAFARECSPPGPANYCSGQVNSQGCYTAMTYNGTASASAGSGFQLAGYNLLNNKPGLLFYSTKGLQAQPFQGGTLCLAAPVRRTPVSNSGGNPPPDDCSGLLLFDFNAFIATGADPSLVECQRVWAQFWSRDPGIPPPNSTNLTDAVTFVIGA
jgi:Tol biopolymer transport system component